MKGRPKGKDVRNYIRDLSLAIVAGVTLAYTLSWLRSSSISTPDDL